MADATMTPPRIANRRFLSAVLKRLFDLVISLLVILIAAPLWVAVAIAIQLDSPGPVFYRGHRVGRGGKLFAIYKFRTMVVDARARGPGITSEADPRITRVGRFLRRFKIDEMPQLINVLKGEMSIVGPRPEDPRYVARYTPEQLQVLSVRPGMASPAFVKYRHEESLLAGADDPEQVYLTQILPDKLRLDLEYIRKQSFLFDLGIFLQAALSLFCPPRRPRAKAAGDGGFAAALIAVQSPDPPGTASVHPRGKGNEAP
jgi:lipopolysaccharide/colanic/teichoic acid biosynthesis glycosyltransferase